MPVNELNLTTDSRLRNYPPFDRGVHIFSDGEIVDIFHSYGCWRIPPPGVISIIHI